MTESFLSLDKRKNNIQYFHLPGIEEEHTWLHFKTKSLFKHCCCWI